PPPPRRHTTGGPDGGDAPSIAAAQAQLTNAARNGRSGAEGRSTGSASPAVPAGPPWRVADSVTGAARGKELSPPHRRHTIAGSRNGQVDEQNTVFLRGQEHLAAQDVEAIAAGQGLWNPDTQRYEVNGRSYGVESTGRMFPDSGPGMVKLDRNEYAALKEIAKAGGDLSVAPQLSRAPRFTSNPDAVAKAKAIYDGTYEP
ncbi:MAG: hypothetical protein SYR96_36055, partial [Actinomycetota bacterium]|nr:hypothetical protein [Actinomycetota bacterium]